MQEEHNHQPGESTVWAPLILTLKTLSVMCQANNNRPFLSSVFNSSPSSWWVFFFFNHTHSLHCGRNCPRATSLLHSWLCALCFPWPDCKPVQTAELFLWCYIRGLRVTARSQSDDLWGTVWAVVANRMSL